MGIDMTVRLISYTMPAQPGFGNNTAELIAYVARISNPSNQGNHATGNKLLGYLMEHKHWSPFEMADYTLEINTTRDIARQILRHRSFSFQEFSQRYAEAPGFSPPRECRMQDTKNRQNSMECVDLELQRWWDNEQLRLEGVAGELYEKALARGVAKEQARAVLPEGLTMSRLYMKGSVRSWIHYLQVRRDPSTQKEHRLIAEQCCSVLSAHMGINLKEMLHDKPSHS